MPERAYRIGYLNPFHEKAENQALMSLKEAAARGGHAMIDVGGSDAILAADLDFVISVATAQPKLTAVPTFGAIHEPKVRLCGDETLFRNILSYDGYLTVSDSLGEFLGSLNAGFHRPEPVGLYYNTPQVSDMRADLPAVVAAGDLELCYFGTNWDRRARPLLRALALKPYMRIHGPEEGWTYLFKNPAYRGSVPFDGRSVQATYAKHGVGLVVLSREHRLDDVISNRIFEITSVGAVAVCPDMPWIRKNFGDTVRYYAPDRSVSANMVEIEDILGDIRANPAQAGARAAEARAIFEERFAAERMISSAITSFEGWKARARAMEAGPVDVILRTGGADADAVGATIASLRAQETGRIRLILAGPPADTAPEPAGAISEITAVPAPAERSAALIAALDAVANPLFAVVDAGDAWTPAHLEEITRALSTTEGPTVALARVIERDGGASLDGDERAERRRLRPWPTTGRSTTENLALVGLEGLLAPSALLGRINRAALAADEQGDATFLGQLLQHAEPVFSHRPTVIARRTAAIGRDGAGGDAYAPPAVVTSLLRLGARASEGKARLVDPLSASWAELWEAVQKDLVAKEQAESGEEEVNAIEGGQPVPSIHERGDLTTFQLPLAEDRLWGQAGTGVGEGEFGASIDVDLFEPHAYCATLDLKNLIWKGPHWVVAEFADITVPFRVGLANRVTEEMVELDVVPASKDRMEVWMRMENPVPVTFLVMSMDTTSKTKVRLTGLWLAREAEGEEPTFL